MAVFTFNDITTLDDRIQIIFDLIDYHTLIAALKTADASIREIFFKNLPKKVADKARNALAAHAASDESNAIDKKESEEAQQEIIKKIKKRESWLAIPKEFTFPDFSDNDFDEKKSYIITTIERACEDGHLYLYNDKEDELRKGFEAFHNRRSELARINSITVPGKSLPVIMEFLEADKIEDLTISDDDPAVESLNCEKFCNLKNLVLSCVKTIPANISKIQSLTLLSLNLKNDINNFSDSISALKNLSVLNISEISSAEIFDWIGNLQSLTELTFHNCENLKTLPDSIGNLKNLINLNINWMPTFEYLPESIGSLQSLKDLSLSNSKKFKKLPDSIGNLINLNKLNISWLDLLEQLPESIGGLQSLNEISIFICKSLKSLPESIGNIQSLTKFYLHYNKKLKNLPERIGSLKNLDDLCIKNLPSLVQLPDSICNLQSLTKLELDKNDLETLPENIGNLQSLTKLTLDNNKNLKMLPESVGNLKNLNYLSVFNCASLKTLPVSIVNIKSLEYVNLLKTGIDSVPESISSIKKFIDSKPFITIPLEGSISYRGFINSYFSILDFTNRFSEKARREGLLALEDELENLEDGFFKDGLCLIVDGTDAVIIRQMQTLLIERENDFYRKKLMRITQEAVLGIQSGDSTPQLILRLGLMVDIKNNPVDAAYKKYLEGDKDAFRNIDFISLIQPEDEREEIRFIGRAVEISEKTREEGLLALEKYLESKPERDDSPLDVFEYGISLLVEGSGIDVWMGLEEKYIDVVLSRLVEREVDPVKKNIAAAKKEAVLSIYSGENTRILFYKLAAYFDKDIAKAAYEKFMND